MTDWAGVVAADFALPDADLGPVVDDLAAALASPDPVLRDEQAYAVSVRWIVGGHLDDHLTELGDRMSRTLRHPEIQARTFAVLVLALAVHRDITAGTADAAAVRRWRDAFADWYRSETDLRGWDERLGWLHAVAHGADALDEFGVSPRLGRADLVELLDLAATRLITPTDDLFAEQEDDRLAYAMTRLLARPELTEEDAVGWVAGIRKVLETRPPGPMPAQIANTIRTLRCLYVMVDRGVHADVVVRPAHHTAIMSALGAALAVAFRGQA